MNIPFRCASCIFRQIVDLAENFFEGDDAERWDFIEGLFSEVREKRKYACPPRLAESLFARLAEKTGVADPFREIKDKSTRLALELAKEFENADLSFDEQLLLAVGGNIIDFGVNPFFRLADAEARIRESLRAPYDRAAARELEERMEKADRIFYILDNCGEAVLDRIFLRRFAGKITLGVRGKPILNDVTAEDLAPSGLGDYPFIDTGRGAPGVVPGETSAAFLDAMRSSDLVVAKGQGNFESLVPDFTERPLFLLFRAKCAVVADLLKQPLDSIQIIGRNL